MSTDIGLDKTTTRPQACVDPPHPRARSSEALNALLAAALMPVDTQRRCFAYME